MRRYTGILRVAGGNYKAVHNMKGAANYVCKDGDVLAHGLPCPWKEWLQNLNHKKSTKAIVVQKMIDEDVPMQEICDNPEVEGFVLTNLAHMQRYYKFRKLERQKSIIFHLITCTIGILYGDMEHTWNLKIADWIMRNFNGLERVQREKQLWIAGYTAAGKTRFLQSLQAILNGYEIPREGYYCTFTNNCDFAWIDEYSGEKKPGFLNQFVGGQTMTLMRKGTYPIIKTKNMPVIIVSNKIPNDLYHNVSEQVLGAINDRFEIVEIPQGMKIDLLLNKE